LRFPYPVKGYEPGGLATYLSEVSQTSCDERPCRSLPGFPWGDVPTPIRTITARHSLFLQSHTRTANSSPRGSPATRAAIRAYHVPYLSHDWF